MRLVAGMLVGAVVLVLPAVLNGVPFLYYDSSAYLGRAALAFDAVTRLAGGDAPEARASADEPPSAAAAPLLPAGEAAATADAAAEAPVPAGAGSAGAAPAGADSAGAAPAGDIVAAASERDGPVVAGRSVYYGAVPYLAMLAGGPLAAVAVQAAATAWLLALLAFRVLGWRSVGGFAALVAGLTLLTPIGFFTGLVMPDFLAPLLVLGVAILVTAWERLTALDRVLLLGLVAWAMASHTTHVLLGLGLVAAAALVRLAAGAAGRELAVLPMALVAAAALGAVAAEAAFARAVRITTGEAPISRPHLTAHLVDHGPGIDFLRERCPGAGFAICDYRARLPMDWRIFLFRGEPGVFSAVPPAMQRRLAAEDLRFALAVAAHDPVRVAGFAAAAALEQLVTFGMTSVQIGREAADHLRAQYPPPLAEATIASPVLRDPGILARATTLVQVAAAAALLILALALAAGRDGWSDPERRPVLLLVAALAAGLVLNAVICGVLASPYPRFQARVIWLLPLAAGLAAAVSFRRRAHAPAALEQVDR